MEASKTKSGQLEKILFLSFFPIENFFGLLPQDSKHSMS